MMISTREYFCGNGQDVQDTKCCVLMAPRVIYWWSTLQSTVEEGMENLLYIEWCFVERGALPGIKGVKRISSSLIPRRKITQRGCYSRAWKSRVMQLNCWAGLQFDWIFNWNTAGLSIGKPFVWIFYSEVLLYVLFIILSIFWFLPTPSIEYFCR